MKFVSNFELLISNLPDKINRYQLNPVWFDHVRVTIKDELMGALPVLQQGREASLGFTNDDLPDFYMNDYSVLGLLVTNLEGAYQVLADKDITVHRKTDHLELDIDRAGRLADIIELLNQNGIDCGIADIIDQVYQG